MKDARFLRMTTATGLIALVLAVAVIAAAAWRAHPAPKVSQVVTTTSPASDGGEAGADEAALREGPDVWEEDCSSCHRPNRKGSLEDLRAWAGQQSRAEVVDFLLQGPDGHPPFDALTDEELASLLQVLGDDAASAEDVRSRR